MTRWHMPDDAEDRLADSTPRENRRQGTDPADDGLGRRGEEDSQPRPQNQASRRDESRQPPTRTRGFPCKVRDRTQSLSESETRAIHDIGRLRIVDTKDLARFVYGGDGKRMELDIRNLRERGLIEEKTLFRAHKPHRRLLTLTRQGRRALSKSGALARNQEIYHGFVNPRELDHDADLYKSIKRLFRGSATGAEILGE